MMPQRQHLRNQTIAKPALQVPDPQETTKAVSPTTAVSTNSLPGTFSAHIVVGVKRATSKMIMTPVIVFLNHHQIALQVIFQLKII